MPLSSEEAAAALKDIAQTEQRSSTAYSYHMASPHLILWGFVWLIGYGAMAAKVHWAPLWLVLSLGGSAGSFYIGWRMSRGKRGQFDWRFPASFFAIFAFIGALLAILQPQTDAQFGAFFPILVALYYALVGIWAKGLRMLFTGAALAALTLIGFFYMRDVFELWMAVVGGLGLILGGLWLRSV